MGVAVLLETALTLPLGAMPLALDAEGVPRSMVALVMGSDTFLNLLFSIPLGTIADRCGRLFVMRVAAWCSVAALGALAVTHGAFWSALAIGLEGVAGTTYGVAEFAYASSLFSEERALGAVASLGIPWNLAFALVPAASVWLWEHGIGREQYAYAMILAAMGAALMYLLPARNDAAGRLARAPSLSSYIRWLPAMGFMLVAAMPLGVNVTLAVLTFHERGIANGALLFTGMTLTSCALRYHAGRLVEMLGPRRIVFPLVLLQAAGCAMAASAYGVGGVLAAGIVLGLGWSAVMPVGLAFFWEESSERSRGAAMGAYTFAFNAGMCLGALLATFSVLAGPGYVLAIGVCAVAPLAIAPIALNCVGKSRFEVHRPYVDRGESSAKETA